MPAAVALIRLMWTHRRSSNTNAVALNLPATRNCRRLRLIDEGRHPLETLEGRPRIPIHTTAAPRLTFEPSHPVLYLL